MKWRASPPRTRTAPVALVGCGGRDQLRRFRRQQRGSPQAHRELLSRRALIPIVDAPAVQQAFKAGVGATISTKLGGTLDAKGFTPLTISAKVRLLADGPFSQRVIRRRMVRRADGCAGGGELHARRQQPRGNLYDRSFSTRRVRIRSASTLSWSSRRTASITCSPAGVCGW